MSITTAVAIFFLIWWVVLFAVLPWGVRSQHEHGEVVPGTDPGAPAAPHLRRTLVWTTLVSVVLFGGCYFIYVERPITIEGLMARLESTIK